MSDLKTAAQQALEALELAHLNGRSGLRRRKLVDSITALRSALAEPVQEPVAEMPSNTRFTVHVEGHGNTYYDNIHDAMTYAQRSVYASVDATTRALDDLKAGLIAEWSYGFSAVRIYPPQKTVALAPRKPEPAEPVAWSHNLIDNIITHRPADIDRRPDRWTPLYAEPKPCPTCQALARTVMMDQTSHDAPPQRKPLTDDQIALIVAECSASAHRHDDFSFARAIEAAHGIGEQE